MQSRGAANGIILDQIYGVLSVLGGAWHVPLKSQRSSYNFIPFLKFFESVFCHIESAPVANLVNIVENKKIKVIGFVNKNSITPLNILKMQFCTDISRIIQSKGIRH